jgi:hypothetical protein
LGRVGGPAHGHRSTAMFGPNLCAGADHLPATRCPATMPTKKYRSGPGGPGGPTISLLLLNAEDLELSLFWVEEEMRGGITIGITPDRSDRPDRGLGEIALLGVVDERLAGIELKRASGSETPLSIRS